MDSAPTPVWKLHQGYMSGKNGTLSHSPVARYPVSSCRKQLVSPSSHLLSHSLNSPMNHFSVVVQVNMFVFSLKRGIQLVDLSDRYARRPTQLAWSNTSHKRVRVFWQKLSNFRCFYWTVKCGIWTLSSLSLLLPIDICDWGVGRLLARLRGGMSGGFARATPVTQKSDCASKLVNYGVKVQSSKPAMNTMYKAISRQILINII